LAAAGGIERGKGLNGRTPVSPAADRVRVGLDDKNSITRNTPEAKGAGIFPAGVLQKLRAARGCEGEGLFVDCAERTGRVGVMELCAGAGNADHASCR